MGNPIHTIFTVYLFVLVARALVSFVPMIKPGWSPGPGVRPIFDVVYALTDPPINALRKVIPQPFGFPLDLAFLVWWLVIYFAWSLT